MAIKMKIEFETNSEKEMRRVLEVLGVMGEVNSYYEVNQWGATKNYPGTTDAEIEGDSNDD